MSIAAALLVFAQSAAPIAAPAPAPVAERASASATIVRPAQVRIAADGALQVEAPGQHVTFQRRRDDTGTIWVEFS